MDPAVISLYCGVVALAVLARAGWRRRRARPTTRYLQALRRVHDATSGVVAPAVSPPSIRAQAAPFTPRTKALDFLSPLRRPGVGRRLVGGRAVRIGAAVATACALAGVGVKLADRSGPGGSHVPTQPPVIQAAGHQANATPTKSDAQPRPAAPLVIAGADGSGHADYTVTSGPVQLALVVSSRCWVEMRAGSISGPVLYEGVLGPGAKPAFENAGGLWLRLGYPPGVAVHVDGQQVGLPASAAPLDVTVDSAATTT